MLKKLHHWGIALILLLFSGLNLAAQTPWPADFTPNRNATGNYAGLSWRVLSGNYSGTDLNGTNHNIGQILASGKYVLIDVSAVWCNPCWQYHTTGRLDAIYNALGPNGSDKLRVFWVEGSGGTTAQIKGASGSQGNWTRLNGHPVPYPLIRSRSLHATLFGYAISGYPSFYLLSPQGTFAEISYQNMWGYSAETIRGIINAYDEAFPGVGGGQVPSNVVIQGPTKAKTGETVSFSVRATSDSQLKGYSWTFDQGNPDKSYESNPRIKWSKPGTYDVMIIVQNNTGWSETSVHRITIEQAGSVPTNVRIQGPTKAKVGEAVRFSVTSSSTTSLTGYSWGAQSANPEKSSAANPSFTWSTPGTYNVGVFVQNNIGWSATQANHSITIEPAGSAPSGVSIIAPAEVEAGTPVSFSSSYTSATAITAYSWSFNGGSPSSSTQAKPSVTWNTPGTYQVQLKLSNQFGQSTTATHSIRVTEKGTAPTNVQIIAPTETIVGSPVTFRTSYSSSAAITAYRWTFEGGSPSSSTSSSPVSVWNRAGTYKVRLSLSNKFGQSNEVLHTITVNPKGTVPLDVSINGPSNVKVGETVKFTPVYTSNDPILQYSWSFSSGTPAQSTVAEPSVRWSAAGSYTIKLLLRNKEGWSSTVTKVVTVSPAGTAPTNVQISAPAETTVGEMVSLSATASSSTAITGYKWTLEGASPSTSTSKNPNVTWAKVGTYRIRVALSNQFGTSTEAVRTIVVKEKGTVPTNVQIKAPSTALVGDVVSFSCTASSETVITRYKWTFKEANPLSSNSKTPAAVWSKPGTYKVRLVLTNAVGDSQETVHTITINPKGTAPSRVQITAPAEATVGDAVTLSATAVTDAPITNYNWRIEGATPSTSNSKTPVVSWNRSGTYSIRLVVANEFGQSAEAVHTIVIKQKGTAPSNVQIEAPAEAMVGDAVSFAATAESASTITGYNWRFEGATPSTSTSKTPVATWKTPGVYRVRLTVSNAYGQSAESIHTITVKQTGTAPTNVQIVAPTEAKVGEMVSFSTTAESVTAITSYAWRFEAGTPSTSSTKAPRVLWDEEGTYNVRLVVANQFGESREVLHTITIKPAGTAPTRVVIDAPAEGTVNTPIAFSANVESSSPITAYRWSFEGATPSTSTLKNPSSRWSTPGTYKVRLVVSNEYGQSTEAVHTITIKKEGNVPTNVVIDAPAEVAIGDKVSFSARAESTSAITDYLWRFEGATPSTSTSKNPTATWATAGTYKVRLVVSNANGPSVEAIHTIKVTEEAPLPTGISIDAPTQYVAGSPVTFRTKLEGSGEVSRYQWTFAGGTPATSTAKNPVITWSNAGTYAVKLVATLPNGSTLTANHQITITGAASVPVDLKISGPTKVVVGTEATFSASATTAPNYPIVGYGWTVGDNSEQGYTFYYTQEIKVTWNKPGTYEMKMIAGNRIGYAKSVSYKVEVVEASVPKDFEIIVPEKIIAGEPATFSVKNNESLPLNRFSWTFQAGSPDKSYSASPVVTWETPGQYTVMVIAENSVGWSSTQEGGVIKRTITVEASDNVPSNVQIKAPAEATVGERVQLECTADSEIFITGYSWIIEGATPTKSDDEAPEVVWNAAGVYKIRVKVANAFGESAEMVREITIRQGASAPTNVVIDVPTSIEVGQTVTFYGVAESSTPITGYQWTFAGATPAKSNAEAPQVTWTKAGSFKVTLVVSNAVGASVPKEVVVNVTKKGSAPTNVQIDAPTEAFVGDQVPLFCSAESSVVLTGHRWTIEGVTPSTSTQEALVVVWSTPGTYTIKVAVSNEFGQSEEVSKTITIKAKGTAPTGVRIDAPREAFVGDKVSFYSAVETTAILTGHSWTFEGTTPATSSDETPIVTWSKPGTYRVTVVVSNTYGKSSPAVHTITIKAKGTVPTVTIDAPSEVNVGDGVYFNCTVNTTSIISGFEWTFDGATPATSTDEAPVVSWSMPGTYTVSLVVRNEYGNSPVATHQIVVKEAGSVPTNVVINAPLEALAGDPVHLSSTSTSTLFITGYNWTFEGGTPATSDIDEPTVTWSKPGNYLISLSVDNAFGSSEEVRHMITVNAKGTAPTNIQIMAPVSGFVGEPVPFNYIADGVTPGTKCRWSFQNGTPLSSTDESPVVKWSMPGNYTVRLTLTNEYGTSKEITHSINIEKKILPPSEVKILAPVSSVQNNYVSFKNECANTSNLGLTYEWTFPGASTERSKSATPSVKWSRPGVYNVSLVISNDAGPSEPVFHEITITPQGDPGDDVEPINPVDKKMRISATYVEPFGTEQVIIGSKLADLAQLIIVTAGEENPLVLTSATVRVTGSQGYNVFGLYDDKGALLGKVTPREGDNIIPITRGREVTLPHGTTTLILRAGVRDTATEGAVSTFKFTKMNFSSGSVRMADVDPNAKTISHKFVREKFIPQFAVATLDDVTTYTEGKPFEDGSMRFYGFKWEKDEAGNGYAKAMSQDVLSIELTHTQDPVVLETMKIRANGDVRLTTDGTASKLVKALPNEFITIDLNDLGPLHSLSIFGEEVAVDDFGAEPGMLVVLEENSIETKGVPFELSLDVKNAVAPYSVSFRGLPLDTQSECLSSQVKVEVPAIYEPRQVEFTVTDARGRVVTNTSFVMVNLSPLECTPASFDYLIPEAGKSYVVPKNFYSGSFSFENMDRPIITKAKSDVPFMDNAFMVSYSKDAAYTGESRDERLNVPAGHGARGSAGYCIGSFSFKTEVQTYGVEENAGKFVPGAFTVPGVYLSLTSYQKHYLMNNEDGLQRLKDGALYEVIFTSNEGHSVRVPLIDYRDGKQVFVDTWTWFDLSALGSAVSTITITGETNIKDASGEVDIPTFFAIDELGAKNPKDTTLEEVTAAAKDIYCSGRLLRVTNCQAQRVVVYDLNGARLLEVVPTDNDFVQTLDLASGVYIVQCGVTTVKIVVSE